MEFKYATSLLFSNMGYILKIFVWILICVLITAAIGSAILIPIGNLFASKTDVSDELDNLSAVANSFLHGEASIFDSAVGLRDGFVALINALTAHTSAFVGLIFALIFLYLLYCFLVGMSYYPTADIINKLMSSNLRFGFASSLAANFKAACKFSFAKMLVALPIDVVIFFVVYGLLVGLSSLIGLFSLPIVLAVALTLCSLRATLFAGWIPRMLYNPDEKVFTAFSRSLTSVKTNFKGLFKAYAITFFVSYALIAGLSVPTFGLMSLVVPATYYFLLRCVELVGYYKTNAMCFYTDATTVINTVEFGYRKDIQDDDENDINY